MPLRSVLAAAAGAVLALLPTADAEAADLKVLAGGSMTAVLGEIGPAFEKAAGHKLTIEYGSTPQLIRQVTSGAAFDLGVVPAELFKDEAARARFVPGPTIDIARVGYGIAVRAGTLRPDISTPEAFRATLLKAQSVAFVPESAAGSYVLKAFETLGIAEAMKAKTRVQPAPAQIAPAVARGDAELGIFLMNVLIAPGVEPPLPFPAALQQELVFAASIAADSRNSEAAKAFIAYLRSPAATAVIKAKGMVP